MRHRRTTLSALIPFLRPVLRSLCYSNTHTPSSGFFRDVRNHRATPDASSFLLWIVCVAFVIVGVALRVNLPPESTDVS